MKLVNEVNEASFCKTTTSKREKKKRRQKNSLLFLPSYKRTQVGHFHS